MRTATMLEYLTILQHEVTEIRLFRAEPYWLRNGKRGFTGNTVAGYYEVDAYAKLIEDIKPFNADAGTKAIYTTLHACDPALLARAQNRLQPNAKVTTADHDIKQFTSFPVDIDPERPKNISATDAELAEAGVKAEQISDFFDSLGIPHLNAMSGNGWHRLILLYPLEATEENAERFKTLGDRVAEHFETDTVIYNPARIWKLYGTTARKGDNTEERPHRDSELYIPDDANTERIDFAELEEKVTAELGTTDTAISEPTPPEKYQSLDPASTGTSPPDMSLKAWLDTNNVPYTKELPYKGGMKYQMDCPFNPAHTSPDAAVYEGSGGWAFKCSHNSCKDKDWKAFRAKVAPKASSKPLRKPSVMDDADTPRYTEADVDTTTTEENAIVFPEALFFGPFASYRDAFVGKNPVPEAFLFATLKQGIASILGRSVYIDTQPKIYPTFYTGLIGPSASGHKSVALSLIRDLLRIADPNVFALSDTATPQGLINLFINPTEVWEEDENGEEKFKGYKDGFEPYIKDEAKIAAILAAQVPNESIRVLGCLDEFSALLAQSKLVNHAGMTQALMTLYTTPPEVVSPTKVNPTRADFPTFGLIGCSTFEMIEKTLEAHLIAAGLTNRIEWYIGEATIDMALFKPADVTHWTNTINAIKPLREVYPEQTAFALATDGEERIEDWIAVYREAISELEHEFAINSIKRLKMHVLKNALIFAALRMPEDKVIWLDDVLKAICLSDYTYNVVDHLFGNFQDSETKRIYDRILEILRKTPHQTKRRVANRMKWAELRDVEEMIERMIRMGILASDKLDGKRQHTLFVLTDTER